MTACAASPKGSGGTTTGGGDDDDGSGSGSDTGSNTPPPAPITVDMFLQQMSMSDCTEAFACMASFPTTGGDTFAQDFGASVSDCVTMENSYDPPATVASEIAAGKITFDGSAAAACVAGITYSTCADYWSTGGDYPVACDTALVGTVADGGACVIDFDCSNFDSLCESSKCTVDTGMFQNQTPRAAGFVITLRR
ncbi:MAG TPA: hypothetical protein VGO00_28870 [Kofleriaceae bacterium]|nr:hypothetical protein [Kofleriaceae bacterium]